MVGRHVCQLLIRVATAARRHLPFLNDTLLEANASTVYCEAYSVEIEVPPLNDSFSMCSKLYILLRPRLGIYNISASDPVLCSVEEDTQMTCNCSCAYTDFPTNRKTTGLAVIGIGNIDERTSDVHRHVILSSL